MKNPFSNPFSNEKADHTEPMSAEEIGDIVFEPKPEKIDAKTRRQFLRRLSNGIIGIGAANRFGSILYKSHDDEVINGHILDIEVENKGVAGIESVSFNERSKRKGRRGKLVIPVDIKTEGTIKPEDTINVQSQCKHHNGFVFKHTEYLSSISGHERVWIGITDKKTVSKSGPPIHAKIVTKLD